MLSKLSFALTCGVLASSFSMSTQASPISLLHSTRHPSLQGRSSVHAATSPRRTELARAHATKASASAGAFSM